MTNQEAAQMIRDDMRLHHDYLSGTYRKALNMAVTALEQLNNVQYTQPRSGKWRVINKFEDCSYAKCNQCNVTQVFYYNKPLTNFCPNCGVKMEGEE